MNGYELTVRAECEMRVYVEADSPQSALRRARDDEYDEPLSDWEPLYPRKIRAVGPVKEVLPALLQKEEK